MLGGATQNEVRGTRIRISDCEKSHYPPSVRVYWQANVGVDTVTMDMIADDFIEDVADIDDDVMYGLDNLGAHHKQYREQDQAGGRRGLCIPDAPLLSAPTWLN